MNNIEIIIGLLLLCPNLTVVALGASTLLQRPEAKTAAGWLLLTGLLVTVFAIVSLPVAGTGDGTRSQGSRHKQSEEKPMPEPAGTSRRGESTAERAA